MKIHKILWLVAILSATAVVAAAILYKLIKKKELLDPKYQVLIAIVQSSQLYMTPILLIVYSLFSCRGFYESHKFHQYIRLIGGSLCLLSALFLVSPAGLILIKNNTSSPLLENIFSILSLVSLYVFARIEVFSLTARVVHRKQFNDVMFYDKKCKP
jgi:hypothetical protein